MALSAAPFTVVRALGAGGTAELSLVRLADGRAALEKRLFAHLAAQPEAASLFAHEVALLARLRVPGVPRAWGAGSRDERPYVLLEPVRGPSLHALLARDAKRGAALDPRVALAAARALLAVLDAAHRAPLDEGSPEPLALVHRDVTPHNVLFDAAGRAHLIDFGVACSALRPDPSPAAPRGTPGYIAPESYTLEAPVDVRADVFSAAVLTWELLTERRLFPGGALAAMAATTGLARSGPPPLSTLRARSPLPRALDEALGAALRPDPRERTATAAALREALGEALEPAPDEALAAWVRG